MRIVGLSGLHRVSIKSFLLDIVLNTTFDHGNCIEKDSFVAWGQPSEYSVTEPHLPRRRVFIGIWGLYGCGAARCGIGVAAAAQVERLGDLYEDNQLWLERSSLLGVPRPASAMSHGTCEMGCGPVPLR